MILATANQGKIKEFKDLLGSLVLPAPSVLSVPEDGNTYYENSLTKALRYYEKFQQPVLADDSGLEVACLNGRPGVHSADFGGNISWPEKWKLLIEELKAFPPSQWNALFRAVLCYYDGKTPPKFFEGTTHGVLVATPKGDKGFGYDPIFLSSDLSKTLAEASAAEKNQISHRARAANNLKSWLDQANTPR